jgi:hypothetical protein
VDQVTGMEVLERRIGRPVGRLATPAGCSHDRPAPDGRWRLGAAHGRRAGPGRWRRRNLRRRCSSGRGPPGAVGGDLSDQGQPSRGVSRA